MVLKVVEIKSAMCGVRVWFVGCDSIDVSSVLSAFEVYIDILDSHPEGAISFLENYSRITGYEMFNSEDAEPFYNAITSGSVKAIEYVARECYRF